MERIQHQRGDLPRDAQLILSWIVHAKRPTTVLELQHALAVEVGTHAIDSDNIPTVNHLLSASAPLVTVDTQSNIIHLSHYTVQEYFEQRGRHWLQSSQDTITRICLTYLRFEAFQSGPCRTDTDFQERLATWPLYDYCAKHWGDHARESLRSRGDVLGFLRSHKAMESSYQALFNDNKAFQTRYETNYSHWERMTAMHLVAYFGIASVFQTVVDWGAIDTRDDHRMTPLAHAAHQGHDSIVQLLLKTGKVDVNAMDESTQTPLYRAAAKGHVDVVRLLLDTDEVDVDYSELANGFSALQVAVIEGHTSVVKALLESGKCDVNICEVLGETPMFLAVSRGDETITKMLLDTGKVDTGATTFALGTALLQAANRGNRNIVQILLDTGAFDVNAKDKHGWTPLAAAVLLGHKAVVELLLDTEGVDVDARDERGRTPLSLAADCVLHPSRFAWDHPRHFVWDQDTRHHEDIIQLLLATGKVDADAKDPEGRTPLSWAAGNGFIGMVELLLDTGQVDANTADDGGRTPLDWARHGGHVDMERLFLSYDPFDFR